MSNERLKEAQFILQQLQLRRIEPKQLTRHQRKLCVRFFMDEHPGMGEQQVGKIIGTSHSQVSRLRQEVIWQDAWKVEQIDYKRYASELIRTYHTVLGKLMANAERLEQASEPRRFQAAVVWEKVGQTFKTMTDQLMELGILKRAPIEFKGQITLLELLNRARELHAKRLEAAGPEKNEATLDRPNGREPQRTPI